MVAEPLPLGEAGGTSAAPLSVAESGRPPWSALSRRSAATGPAAVKGTRPTTSAKATTMSLLIALLPPCAFEQRRVLAIHCIRPGPQHGRPDRRVRLGGKPFRGISAT